jgi:folate-binding protein YgfZ
MNPNCFYVPLADQGLIRARGADAASFLHNLMTNDINHLAADAACHAALCTPKGRMIASFLLWREGDDYLLQLSADILPSILKKLSMYVLRSKVTLTDISAERVLIGVLGGTIGPSASMHSMAYAGGTAIRLAADRCVLALPVAQVANVQSELGVSAPLTAWHLAEIRSGIPRIVAATQEAFVPQMVNYELAAIGGVSFQKGCYPGQEIVARTHYLGKVKRRMVRVKLAAEFPPGTDVFTAENGDQHCGAVVLSAPSDSVAGGFESLLVYQSSANEPSEIHLGSPSGPMAEPLPLPYSVE